MPKIDQQIVFLPVRDLAVSSRFYGEVLGLRMALDQGSCSIFQWTGGAYIGLCERADGVEPAERVFLTLVTQDVEGWHAHLSAHGIETDGPPRENADYKIIQFFAKDPDGYTIEVQKFLDPAWVEKPM